MHHPLAVNTVFSTWRLAGTCALNDDVWVLFNMGKFHPAMLVYQRCTDVYSVQCTYMYIQIYDTHVSGLSSMLGLPRKGLAPSTPAHDNRWSNSVQFSAQQDQEYKVQYFLLG